MCRQTIFIFLLLGVFMNQSAADISSDTCEFYFRGKSSNVSEVQDIFDAVSTANAVKVCTANTGIRAYFVASDISVNNGVQYFHLTRIFAEPIENGIRWNLIPPKELIHISTSEVYMCDRSQRCESQSDSRFVQTKGVTVSAFRELNSSWNVLASSEKLFEKAIQDLSFREKRSSTVKKLKSALYGGEPSQLFSFSFKQDDDSSFPKYTFSLLIGSNMWNVDFDFYSGNEIRFERVVLVEG